MSGKLRFGVDVGGTFTKAVAIETNPYSLVAQALVPTTHNAPEGVARGVVEVLTALLQQPGVSADRVSLVAHSTTQAVNALLEGDTAYVGIIGMGKGRDAADSARYTRIGNIPLAPGKQLQTTHAFIDTSDGLTSDAAANAVDFLAAQGAQTIVASEAFSVDDPTHENLILDSAVTRGLPAVGGHQLTGVYGLEIRTLTAAINASLLPRMLQTAELVERSLQEAGIQAPLMVMRGDGGLTDLATLRQRPILTLLSGPSASLAGALLSGGVADGVFLEVGGTSSNLGIIRGGQPELAYVRVMDHPTCIRSLDVRVQGIAGGSMARLNGRKIADIGPRSAHIADLDYISLSGSVEGDLSLELIAPRPGDPADYAIVHAADGRQWALTLTCAANALGLVPEGSYAYGSQQTAMKGFAALGKTMGCSAEEAARRMLDMAARQVGDAVEALAGEYRLRKRSYQLIGGGGGAGALIPAVAQRLGVSYRLVEHAPIISSLGDALASIREEVERAIADGISTEALARQAQDAAVRAGAEPDSVQVVIERDEDRGTLRAVATGHVALAAPVTAAEVSEGQARAIAVQSAHRDDLNLLASPDGFWVYQAPAKLLKRPETLVMDRRGILRLVVSGGQVISGSASAVRAALDKLLGNKRDFLGAIPSVRLIAGGRLLDLMDQAGSEGILAVANRMLAQTEPDAIVVAILER
ncbi:MAG TPA: hydantoinase/oxoprolinase family protein [Aggregatilineales bacterium]|nr:hydantoinase/oxoprolinase family protein [Aggregatilineales bacterium]